MSLENLVEDSADAVAWRLKVAMAASELEGKQLESGYQSPSCLITKCSYDYVHEQIQEMKDLESFLG